MQQGADKPWLLVVTSDDYAMDPKQVAFLNWFQSDPRLANIAQQLGANFKIWKASNPHYRERFAEIYGTMFPIVSLHSADGSLLVGFDAARMPETPGVLADYFDQVLERSAPETPARFGQCPDGKCPKPNVTPNQQPPNRTTLPVVPSTTTSDIAVVILIVGGVVAAFFLLLAMNKKNTNGFF